MKKDDTARARFRRKDEAFGVIARNRRRGALSLFTGVSASRIQYFLPAERRTGNGWHRARFPKFRRCPMFIT